MSGKWDAERKLSDSTRALTALIKKKQDFYDKMAKKQPELVTETSFDDNRRPKMALGTSTPK